MEPASWAEMPIETISAFVDAIRESRVVDPTRLEQILRHAAERYAKPAELAKYLLHRGWLTPYQANQLLHGEGQTLVLGPYRVLELIGKGGTGQVFKALHTRMNRVVALKFIRRELLADPHAVHRFYREVQTVAQLSHPNIVLAYDADEVGNTHFLAMEYVEGTDLHRLVHETGPLPVGLAADCVRQAALGLQHAHGRGLVHRDIKPANLMVTVPQAQSQKSANGSGKSTGPQTVPSKGFVVKILDLGIARLQRAQESEEEAALTNQGAVLGTPDFVAPEQALDSRTADERADIYSLGCTFYYLLTGKPPFPGVSVMKKLLDHQQTEPEPVEQLRPEVPRGLAAVVRKMMAKRPQDRYQTPADVVTALESAAKGDEPSVRRSLKGHADWVRAVSFSPDGKRLAAADGDGQVWLWELEAGKAPTVLKGHIGDVYAVGFAPGGVVLGSGGWDRTVRLWDCSGDPPPRAKASFQAHRSWVRAIAFAPDGKLLASGGADLTVRLWSLEGATPQEVATLQGHQREVRAVAFSPDGRTLVSAGADQTVRLWDIVASPPRKRFTLRGDTDAVLTAAFAPDGKTLVTAGQEKTVRLWDLTADTPKEKTVLKGHLAVVYAVAFAPDGRTMVSGSFDGQLFLWDAGTDRRIGKWVLPGPIYTLAYSPDCRSIAVGTSDGKGNGIVYLLRLNLTAPQLP